MQFNTNSISVLRFCTRSPSPTRRGRRRWTSWLQSGRSPCCPSPAFPPGPTTCHPCTSPLPCSSLLSAGSTSAPLRHKHRGPVRDSKPIHPHLPLGPYRLRKHLWLLWSASFSQTRGLWSTSSHTALWLWMYQTAESSRSRMGSLRFMLFIVVHPVSGWVIYINGYIHQH